MSRTTALGRLAAVGLLLTAFLGASPLTSHSLPAGRVRLKVLVVSADGKEADLGAIRSTLDSLGTPYTVWIARSRPGLLTGSVLTAGPDGLYQAVILTTNDLRPSGVVANVSALTEAEWRTLHDYEARFSMRELVWYAYPKLADGFEAVASAVDTTTHPIDAVFTGAGRTLWGGYVNTSTPLAIRNAYAYLAKPASDARSVPLLTYTANGATYAMGLLHRTTDGREVLALTFDSNENLMHNTVLGYGLVDWVTKGIFLGSRYAYLTPQVDDFFIDDDIWKPGTPCGTSTDHTGAPGLRIVGRDLLSLSQWQAAVRRRPVTADVRISLAFNGIGADELPPDASLLQATAKVKNEFDWINHTYDHLNLDHASYTEVKRQVERNNRIADQLGLRRYSRRDLVTPDISAISPQRPRALKAVYDAGVRNLVTDTSHPEQANPSPNAGIVIAGSAGYRLLGIPRLPTNLFYNVSRPDEWTAEYNCIFRRALGRDSIYREILDRESDAIFAHLAEGNIDPLMFHEANLRSLDGTHSLLTTLLDGVLARYERRFTLPIRSVPMDRLGELVAARMAFDRSGVQAWLSPGDRITLRVTHDATIPLTGVSFWHAEMYGGKTVSNVRVRAGRSVTLPRTAVTNQPSSAWVPRARVIGVVVICIVLLTGTLLWNRRSTRSARAVPPVVTKPSTTPTATLRPGPRRPWGAVHSWVYWLAGPKLDEIGKTNFELAVIDYSADGSASREFTLGQIDSLRHSSCGRRVLAYLSIGEAENYRFYWHKDWRPGSPSWLRAENPKFPGNFTVNFWEPAWKDIVFAYLDRILERGYDGVYLDGVDVYTKAEDPAARENDMVTFVQDIAAHARAHAGADFGVFAQNAEELARRHPDYVRTLTGVAREETYVRAMNQPTTGQDRADAESLLDIFRRDTRAHLVLTVDYADDPAMAKLAFDMARAKGFVPYVTTEIQNRITTFAGYEPKCTPFG